ncbi:MAG: prepilin-type N-terminal cleavage/methylation domain-containing protein [Actinomycetota bacterium]|nr:prepilin-type N-terminal cleavage/methylation domain-containing protein [Actinomycetota bacterium]
MTKHLQRLRRRATARLDDGMTLPEVLITMVIMGTLLTSLVAATSVILKQQDNSEGRLNNARSEQNVGIWLPSDLASAEDVDTSPGASPCGTECPPGINVGGSNALMLSWTGWVSGGTEPVATLTTVSYRYVQVGDEWQILRVACVKVGSGAPTCNEGVVLHDVPAPPPGQTWEPGVTSPVWVIVVRLALDPAIPDGGPEDTVPSDPTYYTKNGRRVSVTINGGGDVDGAGGGEDTITLTAGGTDRESDLSTSNFSNPPSFGATRSRCGGNFVMAVDTSGSIGSTNMASVRTGITAFIDSFAGTPIKLEIVRFSSTAVTLGAGAGWSRYYDMLVESDVADLKAQVATLTSSGATNWEDAMFRVFKNSDGTVQPTLPDTLIFFTDGMPSYSRLNASSATAPAVADNDDSGLPAATGSSYNQVAWNRAWRIARDYYADVERFIGVYVGTDVNGTSTWREQGAGYHLADFQRGYHQTWDIGFHVDNPQRGYRPTWEYAASGLTYQRANSGVTYQYAASGLTYERKSGSTWSSVSRSTYNSNNTVVGESDNYRVRVTGTLGSWTSESRTYYERSNSVAGQTDGYRTTTGSLGSWTNTTKALYDASNTVAGQTDGFRTTTGSLGNWTQTTEDYYNLNNTSGDSSDGYRTATSYSAPYSLWENTTEALFADNNTTNDETDGWRGTVQLNPPYSSWASINQSTYNSGNTTPDDTDGYRVNNIYSSPYSSWEITTEALYNSNNSTADNSDGWSSNKVYDQPYTFHESATSYSRPNTEILSQIVSEGATVPAVPSGGPYTNAAVADMYILPNWDQFAGALNSMALAECGGTVTVQTKVGSASAADPFTYQNSADLTIATTSAQYRSGTFDFDLSGGVSVTADITPLNLSGLTKYTPVSWSCKSAGADYPFVVTPIPDSPWSKITLTVAPNTAISCVQQVALT